MMDATAPDITQGEAIFLYAIVRRDDCSSAMPGAWDDGLYLIERGEFAAIVRNTAGESSLGGDRQALARRLIAHQEVIERVMAFTFVLPVKFGTLAPDRDRVECCLERGSGQFEAAFEAFAGKTQFEILVTWDIEAVFGEIAAEPEIARLRAELAAGCGGDQNERIRLGHLVKKSLERRRSGLSDQLVDALRRVAIDSIANPLMDDRMVLNLALLIDTARTDSLDRCLEALDAAYNGTLTFRCVGPLPPHSFATVEIAFLEELDIAHAQSVLQLDNVNSCEELRAAYRRRAKQTHPDLTTGAAYGADMTVLREACDILTSFVEAGGPVIVSVRRQEATGETTRVMGSGE